MVDSVSVRFKNARVEKLASNIRIQWNAGTACVSECVLKTLACRGLRVGPSKTLTLQSLLFWKKQGFSPKKSKGFSLRGTLKSLEKDRRKNAPKKQGKSENEKSNREIRAFLSCMTCLELTKLDSTD